jgi:hypothetical protein
MKLVSGEGEIKVGLRKARDSTTKSRCHVGGGSRIGFYGNKSAFMIINYSPWMTNGA